MREMINYVIEANVALLLFLTFYRLFLHQETNFRLLRSYLLMALMVSLVFPLIHLNSGSDSTLSISKVIPEYWLPEISVGGGSPAAPVHAAATTPSHDTWTIIGWVYIAGIALFATWLIMQLGYVIILIAHARPYRIDRFRIIESTEDKPTFSFFNLIYIGKANELTETEKQQVIRHETIHAEQLHSIDILLSTLISTVFWFNPWVRHYKRHFIQLHEFEADARAVENSDVNKYCSLLARVALQSHFPIASHFNESLTVKRIEMIRTVKTKIKSWKMAMIASSLVACFVIISCNDQIVEDFEKSTISQVVEIPEPVKKHMDEYKLKHPEAKLTYMEGAADDIVKFAQTPEVKDRVVYEYDFKGSKGESKGVLLTDVVQHAEALQNSDKVFMVVEQQPEYPGGFDALKKFIADNLKYPSDASEGVVYVSFVIDQNGKVTEPKVLRGISEAADAEAVRVVGLMPNWKPGKQNGMTVKCRFNIPFKFDRGSGSPTQKDKVGALQPVNEKMIIEHTVDIAPGQTKIRGKVLTADHEKLPGVNVILAGTTSGVRTDSEGHFIIETSQSTGDLVFSFVGYDSQVVKF